MCACAARSPAIAGPHASGHCYFALKDEKAKIDAVIWRGVFGALRFKPEEGMEVIATGKVTSYPGSSKYQIVIDSLEPAGVGALMALLEERKRKLGRRGPVRAGAQAADPVPAARDRHRHIADRRRHPRYDARLHRALSRPCDRLAGARPGRDLRGRSGGRRARLQCHDRRADGCRVPTC